MVTKWKINSNRRRCLFDLASVWILYSCFTFPLVAQEFGPTAAETPESKQEKHAIEKTVSPKDQKGQQTPHSRGALVAAPLPISSPALGLGVIPVVAYLFPLIKSDQKSPTSTVGIAGLITDNGSRGLALGAELFFGQNRYKLTSAYARGNLDYNIYTPGVLSPPEMKLPLKQTGQLFLGEFLRRTWRDFFLGPRFFNGGSLLTFRKGNSGTTALPPDLGFHTNLRSVGLRLQRDTRTNHYYPTRGTFTDFVGDFFAESIGSKYTFQSYNLRFNKYVSLTQNQVLAFGSFFCATQGRPPFYGNCIYGARDQLRGYTAGRYVDRYMMTSQIEYRLVLPMRFGLIAFGGAGGVIPGKEQFLVRNTLFLPSGGLGVRFMLSKEYHFNVRADISQGTDGRVFSMGVGEAF